MGERRSPEPLGLLPAERVGAGQGAGTGGGADAEDTAAEVPFEEAIAELEGIVRQLESGDLGLEHALRLYERGVALVRLCGAQLDRAEERLQVLSLDAQGKPVLQPLEESGA